MSTQTIQRHWGMFHMDAPRFGLSFLAAVSLAVAACAPAAPAQPTAAPAPAAKPTAAPPPAAKPTSAAPPAAKPTEATKPAVPAQPTSAPAAAPATSAPVAAKPTTAPAAAFNEQAVADFYKGKTIRIIVGFAPGGGYDTSARLLAKHMGKNIPGNPNIIVENMPGAGSMVSANNVYRVADKDGTVIGTFNSSTVMQQALGASGVEFDARKFNWIGAMAESQTACAVRTEVGINSFKEVMAGKQLLIGSESAGTTTFDMPAVFKGALKANIKLVPGYEGTSKIRLAMESKEVDGLCFSWDSLKSSTAEWFDATPPFAKILIITGDTVPNHPWLKDVPAAESLAPNDEARTLLKAIRAPTDMTRPYAMAPEVPAERVAAIRAAFDKTVVDKDFLADAQKAKLEQSPSNGAKVEGTVKLVLETPAATLAKLKEMLKGA